MTSIKELQGKIQDRSQKLHQIFEEAGADYDFTQVKSIEGTTAAKVDEVRRLNTELDDLGQQFSELKEMEAAKSRAGEYLQQAQTPANPPAHPDGKSGLQVVHQDVGQLFTKSVAYTHKGETAELHDFNPLDYLGTKALFETTAGWPPETTRNRPTLLPAEYALTVSDLPMRRTTNQTAITYMEETTTTHNATEIAEGGTFPESAYALTEQTSPVRKVATWIPVTDEQLEDVAGVEQYLRNRLTRAMNQRIEGQIIAGNGTAPNLSGILDHTIQTQAKGTDPTPDAVYKAMTLLRVNAQAMPDAVVFHPTDWQEIRLLATTDGIYIWGSPSEPGPQRIWGVPVVLNQAISVGTALVGDFGGYSEIAMRRGAEFQVTNSHADYFINGKQAIRLDTRLAFVVYRPFAFCSVTGV